MRTSFRHQSEAQPPNGPLTAAASPDTPSHMPRQAVQSPPDRPDYSTFPAMAGKRLVRTQLNTVPWIVIRIAAWTSMTGGFRRWGNGAFPGH
jgi:hypothetical protein